MNYVYVFPVDTVSVRDNCGVLSLLTALFYLSNIQKDGDEQSSGKVAAAVASAMGYGTENETK